MSADYIMLQLQERSRKEQRARLMAVQRRYQQYESEDAQHINTELLQYLSEFDGYTYVEIERVLSDYRKPQGKNE